MLCSIFFFFFLYHNRSRGKSNIQNTHSGVGAISDICVGHSGKLPHFQLGDHVASDHGHRQSGETRMAEIDFFMAVGLVF